MRILLAEDESELRGLLTKALRTEGWEVDAVASGKDVLTRLESGELPHDVMALDILLPGTDGLSILKQCRAKGITIPVIMITGKGEVGDRIHGLDLGADDYLPKPFSVEEFLARVRALSRRPQQPTKSRLQIGPVDMDRIERRVRRNGQEVPLTNTEFSLLEILMERAPDAVPKAEILSYVWGNADHAQTNSLNVHIKHLRDKIEAEGQPEFIVTVRKIGFAVAFTEKANGS